MDLGSNPERAASFKLVGNTMILGVLELLAESMTLADQSGVGKENLYKLIQGASPRARPCSAPDSRPKLTRFSPACRALPGPDLPRLRQEAPQERLQRRGGLHARRRHQGRCVRPCFRLPASPQSRADSLAHCSHIRHLGEQHNVPLPMIDRASPASPLPCPCAAAPSLTLPPVPCPARASFTVAHQHLVSARAAGGSDLDWSSLVGGVRIASGLPAFKDKVRRPRAPLAGLLSSQADPRPLVLPAHSLAEVAPGALRVKGRARPPRRASSSCKPPHNTLLYTLRPPPPSRPPPAPAHQS